MLKKITHYILCGLSLAATAFAQPPFIEQVAKITAADGAAEDWFGVSVAVHGDTAIVRSNDSDSAYIFEREPGGSGSWSQVAKLTVPDGELISNGTVAVGGDIAVVGSSHDDDADRDAGAVYVFMRNQGGADNWGQVVKLTAADAVEAAYFGIAVSLSGDTLLVGAFWHEQRGAAYIFERNQGGPDHWGQVAKLTAADAGLSDDFGRSVSLSGDTAIVGAQRDDDKGSAYVFGRNQGGADNWGQVAKLTAADATLHDDFGYSVSVDGDTVVVGANHDDDGGHASGSAYVFERNQGGTDNWGQVAKLTAADAVTNNELGASVSVSGDTVIAGAYLGDNAGNRTGTAYVFHRDFGGPSNWGQVTKLTVADAGTGDSFGWSVAGHGHTVIVGAMRDDDAGTNSGSAYIFRLNGPSLTVPMAIPAANGTPVKVPVHLNTHGKSLAGLAFSVDYDPVCLSFDPADNDADGIPDAVGIQLPSSFSATIFHDLGDTDGELDIAVYANDPTTTTFNDGTLAEIAFTPTCSAGPIDSVVTPVTFSTDPMPSFGDPDGQAVFGASENGSVEIFSGLRGDCNADGIVSAPDITACQLESFDGDGIFWADTLDAVPFLGSPVGCDANADTEVGAGDISCKARLIFGLTCDDLAGALVSENPRLTIPGVLHARDGVVTVGATLEPGGFGVNSLIFSLDYDETRLMFDDVAGAVRFLGTPVSLQSLSFDAGDMDGELDVVLADLTTTRTFTEGVVLEVDLRVLTPGDVTIENGVTFSTEPPASFGTVDGRGVPGSAGVAEVFQGLFADGFESGDTSRWGE